MKKLILVLAYLLVVVPCQANPIPWPPPATMPLEDMYVEIQAGGDGLHAVFTGDFTFTYIPEDVNSMLFPVPPDANNIGVWQDDVELAWAWSSQLYPTILEEIPNIPMIEWQGPFPEYGAVFTVDYEHDLIKRPTKFIFFYALGTGKYFPTYGKTTTAYFDILLPVGFTVAGVWLDETAHEYEVVDGHLMVTVESWFSPITNDLIVSLVPTTIYVATDGNDVTGDGSEENPFRTIQKGIDTAADGYTVIVQPGLYEENINFLGKNITLKSTDPTNENIINSTIIDGTDVNSVVTFSGTESSSCVLSGFTITNGMAPGGGGIYGNGTMATIENNTICGNAGTGGGKPGDYGAGGGFLDCDGLIQNNTISGNSGGFGGGLCDCDGTIQNNIISENGWYAGGGLFACHGMLSNNLLFANGAVYGGGLVFCNGAISNCTVVANWSAHDGSGLDDCNGSISNCIIWQNSQPTIGQIENCSTPTYSCIEDWDGGGIGNISADPCFVLPGYWDTNGVWVDGDYHLKSEGWRWDAQRKVWTWDDVTSRCIDAGNPGSPLGDELLSVPDDPNNIWGQNLRINMGAFGGTAEASMPPYDWAILGDLTNDGKVDSNDLAAFVNYWLDSGGCIPSDLGRNQSADLPDFALLAQDWLKQTTWHE